MIFFKNKHQYHSKCHDFTHFIIFYSKFHENFKGVIHKRIENIMKKTKNLITIDDLDFVHNNKRKKKSPSPLRIYNPPLRTGFIDYQNPKHFSPRDEEMENNRQKSKKHGLRRCRNL